MIVKECARLLARDELWRQAIANTKRYAKFFFLDALIGHAETSYRKIGEAMGALLMVRIPSLELSDIVNEDYSMEKINQAILKFVINTQTDQKHRLEGYEEALEHIDELQ